MHGVDVENALNSMRILIDTREKKNNHIQIVLNERKCPFKPHKLNYGDYTCEYDIGEKKGICFENKVVIERKANLDELAGNITKGRERFEREFLRAKKDNAKIYLMVENGSYDDIQAHKYRSALPPKSYLNTLFSWQEKYNITISFVSQQFSGHYIYATLYMALKNQLLYGGG